MKSMIYASLALAVVCGSAAVPLMRTKPMDGDVQRIAVSSGGDAKITRKRSGELPQGCREFKDKCAANLLKDYPVANQQEAKGGFELCCIGAGHKNSTCTSISAELFDHDPESMPTEQECKELTDLSLAHDAWKEDHSQSSLLEATSKARAELVVKRMAELEAIMPRQIQMLAALSAAAVAGVAVGGASLIGGVASVGHVAISAVAAGLAVRLQGCDEASSGEAIPHASPGFSYAGPNDPGLIPLSGDPNAPLPVISAKKEEIPVAMAGRLYTTASGALTAKIVASSLASAAMPGNCDVVWCV